MWNVIHLTPKVKTDLFSVCIVLKSYYLAGWQAMLWASVMPLVVSTVFQFLTYWSPRLYSWVLIYFTLQVLLAIGTQLQAILTKMALEITERHAVVQGIPLVQASDKYFWFSRPRLILHLIHFVLFQVLGQNLEFDTNFRHSHVTNCFTIFLLLTECFPDHLLLVDLGNGTALYYDIYN